MKRFQYLCMSAVLSLLLSGCSSPHGQPQGDSEAIAPSQVSDFATLYSQNCAGCHGAQGRGGAAIALANPVYLAIVDHGAMRKVIENGMAEGRGALVGVHDQHAHGVTSTLAGCDATPVLDARFAPRQQRLQRAHDEQQRRQDDVHTACHQSRATDRGVR